MSYISASVRLRPVRFAFLAKPDDGPRVLEIFRINACLWGGQFNPIVPYFEQIPSWWDRHGHQFETPAQIVNGYLDFFEPDFVVEAEPGLGDALGFDKARVIHLLDLLTRQGDREGSGHGLSTLSLYRDLYRKAFQFTRRHEHDIIDVTPEDPSFTQFSACMFGAFPTDPDLMYFGKAFTDALEPKKVSLNAQSLVSIYRSGFTSALRVGHSDIKVDYHDRNDPALFVLNAHEPRDLVDFWNLRAVRRHIIPVPVQWISDVSEFSRDFITKAHRPLPGNRNGVMIHATVMFSRSIPTDDIAKLHTDHFRVDVADANVRQDWYPAIWQPSPEVAGRRMRPTLSAAERTFDTPFVADEPTVRFDSLYPEFADVYGNENRWVNVVKLRDWTHRVQIATVFPCDYKKAMSSRLRLGGGSVVATTEGFLAVQEYKNASELWRMPGGTTAIQNWLATHGIKAVLSDAGRATEQIIQALGGFGGVASFAEAGIVRLLNEVSRRPISRSIHHQEFRNRVRNATGNDAWGKRKFENLVQRGAVELGLELKCTKCSSWSWYPLKQLDYQMSCSLCLRQFGFPITEPSAGSNARWSYRLIGPFALPDYAKGGYAASLSIRFFADILGLHEVAVTWSAGQTLELAPQNTAEADFILWYQRKRMFGNDYPTDIIFGEAKSFGKEAFGADDVERMKALALRVPGSVLVFSTMKLADELSKDEIQHVTGLAEWGREYLPQRQQTRAPVIVLTGTELFANFSLREAWKEKGGRHAELVEPGWLRVEDVKVLADLTQQLYLNMPSYAVWFDAKRMKGAFGGTRGSSGEASTPEDPTAS